MEIARGSAGTLGQLRFEPIRLRAVPALQSFHLPLAFSCEDKMLEATGRADARLAALFAPPISLHPQLEFALSRDRQVREFISDFWPHEPILSPELSAESQNLEHCSHTDLSWPCLTPNEWTESKNHPFAKCL